MTGIRSAKPITLTSPAGEDLLFRSMQGQEQIGRLFEFQVELLSPKEDVDIDSVLGESMTVRMDLFDGEARFFDGKVSSFGLVGRSGGYATYRATLHPWFWLLTRSSDCKIWQEKTVPEIVCEVFDEHGFTDYEDNTQGTYRPWVYCVQYRESAFQFVSRLLEHEGIYYYWKHDDGKHTMVMCDDPSAHEPFAGYDELPYFPPDPRALRERDHIDDWSIRRQVQAGSYDVRSFDFVKPTADLDGNHEVQRGNARADLQRFDYHQVYDVKDDGGAYAKWRLEELQASYEIATAHANARGIAPGHVFDLAGHPREDQARKYLVRSATYRLENDSFESGGDDQGSTFDCDFTAMDAETQFRPERITPKPVIQGPQTAIVTGASGDEICTDEHGRVKVQFHWDRHGAKDKTSSCWIRVGQVWAGQNWGSIHIPRVGQEVIVEFLDGDPDRPLITGRVYNGDNGVPYELPANATQSGIKSRSSKGGGPDDFNEIRFEDKAGEEEMYIHAQKDQNTVVENDQAILVQHDRSETIDRDRSLNVKRDKSEVVERNKTIQILGDHSESVSGAMSITVAKTLTESVLINYAETVGGAMEVTVGGLLATTVGAAMTTNVGAKSTESVGGSKSTSVGGDHTLSVGGDVSETVKKNRKVKIEKDLTETVGGKQEVEITEELIVNAKKIQFVAEDEMSLKVGKAEIILKKSGDIQVKGKKINVKGSGDVIIKGSKIKEN